MKILQSCGSLSWGGLEITALKTSLMLSRNGHEVHLLCSCNSSLESEAKKNNIFTIPISFKNISLIKSIKGLIKIITHQSYKVIHTHLSHDLWAIVPALRFSGYNSKLFLSKHMGSGVRKKDILHKYLYDRVNHIFAVSDYVKRAVLMTCPVKEEKISILHPGLSLEKYNQSDYSKTVLRKELNIPENTIVIGMTSRISPGKGHEEFLKAAKILRKTTKTDMKFIIAGGASFGEEEYENKIKQLAGELGLADITLFTGFIKNLQKILAIFDIFVFPSHEESFGIALTEAMAMGLPAIASGNGGILDIAVNNRTGLLFPPKDYGALADSIKKLAENPDLRKSFGLEGRKRIEEIFKVEDELNKLEEFYAG
jgi:glycosyltransferase involved in cell wall biosynthesis